MEESASCPFEVSAEFNDFDLFTESTRAWDLDFFQLERGTFHASLKQLGFPDAHLGEASFSKNLEQHGASPPGVRTFVISPAGVPPFKWRGYEVSADEMLVFPRNQELYSISQGGFHIYTYSIDESLLVEAGLAVGLPQIENFLESGVEVVSLSPQRMQPLRLAFAGLFFRRVQMTSPDDPRDLRRILSWDFACLLVEALMESTPSRELAETSAMRTKAIKKASELVNDFSSHPVTVEMICRETGVKARTLQYAFREHYQMSPKQWLKLRSLNFVRKELRKADPKEFKVADIANHWGIWHMGQFAKDYREAFGELPSDTLQRS